MKFANVSILWKEREKQPKKGSQKVDMLGQFPEKIHSTQSTFLEFHRIMRLYNRITTRRSDNHVRKRGKPTMSTRFLAVSLELRVHKVIYRANCEEQIKPQLATIV